MSAELVPRYPRRVPLSALLKSTRRPHVREGQRGAVTTSCQAYALLLLGSLTVADACLRRARMWVISNMKGPTEFYCWWHQWLAKPPWAYRLRLLSPASTPRCASPSALKRRTKRTKIVPSCHGRFG